MSEWRELERRAIGLYASGPVGGPGWSNPGYYHLVYEVSEYLHKEEGGPTEYRTRIENGPACRDYGEGYSAFCSLYAAYWDRAEFAKEGENG